MYARHQAPVPLAHPLVMIANARMQELERDIEQIRLARLARASRPRASAPLPALLQWLRARLAARAGSKPTGALHAAESADGA